jgi:hypothetical protein
MSEFSLPSTVNYQEQLQAIPKNTQCINIATAPSNGASFVSGNQIYFDVVNRGFLDPQSVYISYTYTVASTVSGQEIIGTPVYQPFNRCEVSIGSVTIDQIQNYNLVMNTMVNGTFSVAEKYGQQSSYNWYRNDSASTGNVPSLEQLDGHLCTVSGEVGTMSAPLFTIFSSAEKLIPLFAMGAVRITLTVDAISNIFTNVAVPTGFTLSNMVLRYKIIDFGPDVEQAIRMANPNGLTIKTQSFSSASTTLAANTTGYNELIYNLRYSSIKSLIAVNGNGATNSNRQFDSVDLTSGNGDYSFSVNGVIYPQKPLNTRTNKTEILQEFRSAVGSIYDKNNSCSINMYEFSFNGTAAASTYAIPAKFYVGTSLERMVYGSSSSLLTGVSSADSPITYRINTGTSIGANNSTVSLIVNYDALLIVDPNTKQTVVKE